MHQYVIISMVLSQGAKVAILILVVAVIIAVGLGVGLGVGLKPKKQGVALSTMYPCKLNTVTTNPIVNLNPANTTQVFNRIVAITSTDNDGNTTILNTRGDGSVHFADAPDLSDLSKLDKAYLFVLRPKVYGGNIGSIGGSDYFGLQSLEQWNNILSQTNLDGSAKTTFDAQQSYVGWNGNLANDATATYWNPGFTEKTVDADQSNITFSGVAGAASLEVMQISDGKVSTKLLGVPGNITIHFIDNNAAANSIPGVADLCTQATSCIPIGAVISQCAAKN